ncbi:MAG: transglutaminase family protein [Acidimicrobiales bacterium]
MDNTDCAPAEFTAHSHAGDGRLTSLVENHSVLHLRVGCSFTWKAELATAAIVQVEPRLDRRSVITRDHWSMTPEIASRVYWDGFGNRCRRLTLPGCEITLSYDAYASVGDDLDLADAEAIEVAPADLPDETLAYTLPSRFCPSDLLADEAWARFGGTAPGYGRVRQICDFVHEHLTWTPGTTTATSSALDVFDSGVGVCRDFAHLGISLCRSLNIPARYAFGYLPDIGVPPSEEPMDFCAWMEVFLGGTWFTFDPRNNERRAGRVLIGVGRDALDVAMFTTFGGPELLDMRVWADIE